MKLQTCCHPANIQSINRMNVYIFIDRIKLLYSSIDGKLNLIREMCVCVSVCPRSVFSCICVFTTSSSSSFPHFIYFAMSDIPFQITKQSRHTHMRSQNTPPIFGKHASEIKYPEMKTAF